MASKFQDTFQAGGDSRHFRESYTKNIQPHMGLAENGHRLRSPILNMLWGAIFTESWIQAYRQSL